VKGFGGDTMHMARLQDPSRMPGQYALSSLSELMSEDIVKTREQIIDHLKKKYEADKSDPKSQKCLQTLDLYMKNADKI
jgi:hypothetical protein